MAASRVLLGMLPVVMGLVLLSGCGKKGALIPPEALAPAPVSDLALAQKGGRFQVSWSAPSKEEGGATLKDLAGFQLFKRMLLPPAQDCETCPSAYSQLARIDLDYLQGVRRVGNLFLVDDGDLKQGKSYQYKVRSFTTDGTQSRDSNVVRRSAVTAPLPPVLEALSSETGVVLAFVALPPEEGTLIGYNVYRSKMAETPATSPAELISPLNATPITGTTFEDKGLLIGVRYSYIVTTLAAVNGETVESAPSNRAEGAILDRD